VGTRSFAGEVATFAEEAGLEVAGLLEPYARERVGTIIHGYPVTWLEHTAAGTAVIGTGEPDRRRIVARALEAGWRLASLVHPRAHVSGRSSVGVGTVVDPGVVIGAYTAVAEHVVLGRGALLGHHTQVGAYATVGPGANIGGNTRIEPGVFIGLGALVRDHVTVGAGAQVAMGAVVVSDVAPDTHVRGVPAAVHDPRT
jgi:sugar O-acyltransferase (sialic acid O-acetyltransferase NeuD family)